MVLLWMRSWRVLKHVLFRHFVSPTGRPADVLRRRTITLNTVSPSALLISQMFFPSCVRSVAGWTLIEEHPVLNLVCPSSSWCRSSERDIKGQDGDTYISGRLYVRVCVYTRTLVYIYMYRDRRAGPATTDSVFGGGDCQIGCCHRSCPQLPYISAGRPGPAVAPSSSSSSSYT